MAAKGHRLLLAHLFLPDTLAFHAWDEDSDVLIESPAPVDGDSPASHSPASAAHHLPLHELPDRLASAAAAPRPRPDLAGSSEATPPHAAPAPVQPQPRYGSSAIVDDDDDDDADAGPELPASGASHHRSRSARSSFNDGAGAVRKSINMSSLISEAAAGGSASESASPMGASPAGGLGAARVPSPGPGHAVLGVPRSRRSSPSGGSRPSISVLGIGANSSSPQSRPAAGTASDIPVAVASDHGRGAFDAAPAQAPHVAHPVPSIGVTATSRTGSGSSSSTIGALPKSRRSSFGAQSPFAPPAFTQSSAPEPAKSGTKTPGAHAGGKAGTLTPLSIIGDLTVSGNVVMRCTARR